LGHRRIAFVSGPLDSPSFRERLEGFRQGLSACNLAEDESLVQCTEEEPGYAGMKRILKSGQPPDAVFAANDAIAVMAMRAIHEHQLDVPGDISVMGFDDSRSAMEVWPTLTTMHVDMEGMGQLAVRHLVARVRHEEAGGTSVVMHPELVVRESTQAIS
jgi:DNA-binding LacI/PurR family transcriptional regulator